MKKTPLLLFLSLPILLVACASGHKQPRVELTGDHLKAMVLTRDDLGPDYSDVQLAPGSGPRTSEQLVEESNNPDDEALDVAKFAILLGHEDTYFSARALQDRSGVIFLTDGIVLYADAKGAGGDLADTLGDQQKGFSGTTKYGTLQAFQTFGARVGESAHGEVIRLLSPGANFGLASDVNVTITSVEFKRERMVGAVVMMRFDARDVRAEVTDLARKLDKRMQAVLDGQQPPGSDASTRAE